MRVGTSSRKSQGPSAHSSKYTRPLTSENLYKGNARLGVGATQQAQVLVDMSLADDAVLRVLGPPLYVYMYVHTHMYVYYTHSVCMCVCV